MPSSSNSSLSKQRERQSRRSSRARSAQLMAEAATGFTRSGRDWSERETESFHRSSPDDFMLDDDVSAMSSLAGASGAAAAALAGRMAELHEGQTKGEDGTLTRVVVPTGTPLGALVGGGGDRRPDLDGSERSGLSHASALTSGSSGSAPDCEVFRRLSGGGSIAEDFRFSTLEAGDRGWDGGDDDEDHYSHNPVLDVLTGKHAPSDDHSFAMSGSSDDELPWEPHHTKTEASEASTYRKRLLAVYRAWEESQAGKKTANDYAAPDPSSRGGILRRLPLRSLCVVAGLMFVAIGIAVVSGKGGSVDTTVFNVQPARPGDNPVETTGAMEDQAASYFALDGDEESDLLGFCDDCKWQDTDLTCLERVQWEMTEYQVTEAQAKMANLEHCVTNWSPDFCNQCPYKDTGVTCEERAEWEMERRDLCRVDAEAAILADCMGTPPAQEDEDEEEPDLEGFCGECTYGDTDLTCEEKVRWEMEYSGLCKTDAQSAILADCTPVKQGK